ncbi:MAG: hypothetical protein KDK51_00330, partial [Deltaproteobacteria bacterium]|nr:hypothetical protein [Deltaproteobacteria bacterium]
MKQYYVAKFSIFGFLLCLGLFSSQAWAQKKPVEKASDLPQHAYNFTMQDLDGNIANIFDEKYYPKLQSYAKKIRRDLQKDLRQYDIQDETTLKIYWGRIGLTYL